MTPPTLLEFIRPLITGSRRDLCLATMYHLQYEQGIDRCTASELKSALVAARVPKAKTFNVADVLGKSGHLVSTTEKNAAKVNLWQITESGTAHVREKLDIRLNAHEVEIKNDISIMEDLVKSVADDSPELRMSLSF